MECAVERKSRGGKMKSLRYLFLDRPLRTLASPLGASRLLSAGVVAMVTLVASWAPASNAATQTFVSDTTWAVADAASNPLGLAQFICLSPGQPPSCPPGATFLTASGTGWAANLSSIPGAHWILAPGITGATPNASLARFSFTKTFTLVGTPVSGTISIAVDDFAQVFVNGNSAGTYGSITNVATAFAAQNALTNFNITPFLVSGTNTITVAYQ